MKKLLLIAITLLTVLALAGCSTPATAPPSEPTTPAPTPTPPPVADQPTFEKIVITGSADKKSPPFEVTTDEWVINWSYEPSVPDFAVFGFFVYPRGETVIFVESVLAGMGGETSGSTYSYAGVGEYYIDVTAANIGSWKVIISPAK